MAIYKGGRLRSTLKYKKIIPPSQWARQNFRLEETSAVRGAYYGTRAVMPFSDFFIDTYARPNVKEIGYLTGSQVGKTTSLFVLLNWLIDLDPSSTAFFFPSDDLALFTASERIVPSIKRCEVNKKSIDLAHKFQNKREKMKLVRFIGGFCRILSSESPKNRKSMPVRNLFLDEVAEMQPEHVKEIQERAKTYSNFGGKVCLTSTPEHKKDPIMSMYYTAECVVHWGSKCPHCGSIIEMDFFRHMKYPSRDEVRDAFEGDEEHFEAYYRNVAVSQSRFVCHVCENEWDDHDRDRAVQNGNPVFIRGDIQKAESVCVKVDSMVSPLVPLRDLVKAWVAAEHDPDLIRKFYVGWLAKIWEQETEGTKAGELLKLRIDVEEGIVPRGTSFISMTVDVQLDHFWVTLIAHRFGNSHHILKYGRLETWTDIEAVLNGRFMGQDGEQYGINVAAIDSGYRTSEVYDFCSYHPDICIPIKGAVSEHAPEWVVRLVEADINGQKVQTGMKRYDLCVSYYKNRAQAKIHRSLSAMEEGNLLSQNNVLTIHKDAGMQLAEQLTSEAYYTKDAPCTWNKKAGWQKKTAHAQNHLWDTLVYALFLARLGNLEFLSPPDVKEQMKREATVKHTTVSSTNNVGGWMNEY